MKSKFINGLILKLSVSLLFCLFLSQTKCGGAVNAVQGGVPARQPIRQIDFNRDVRPILADKCWRCHGPDATAKKIKPRLDSEEAATADRGG